MKADGAPYYFIQRMAFNAGGALEGAGSGAAAGSAVFPGVGTAIGGVLGGLIGGFDSGSSDPGAPPNPYAAQEQATINEDLNSHVGKDAASAASGQIQHEATKEYQSFAGNPDFAGNANVQTGALNKIQGTAEHSMIDANLSGAATDQAAKQAGLSAAMGMNQMDMSTWKTQQDYLHQPSALSAIFAKGAGQLIGKGVGGLGGGDDTSGGSNSAGGAISAGMAGVPLPGGSPNYTGGGIGG